VEVIPYKKAPHPKIELPMQSTKGAYADDATLKGWKFVPEKH
jgi:hypothetical protein